MEDEGIGGSPRAPASDDEEEDVNKSRAQSQVVTAAAEEREARVMKQCNDIVRFRFDENAGEWCDITMEYDAEVPKAPDRIEITCCTAI